MGEPFMKRLILLGTLILCAGPWFSESARAQSSFDPAIAEMISHVSDSTMLTTIASLQSFGTRCTLASNRDSVAQWIRGCFLEAGFTDVALDSFSFGGVAVNVVATAHGTADSEIVVGAHYDSWSDMPLEYAPGADDNASGTAAVLELARVVSAVSYKPASTIRFIAFSGEEQGLVGSYAYAQKAKDANRHIGAMLSLDMIGYRNVGDTGVRVVWYEGDESLMALDTAVIRQYTTLTPVLNTTHREGSDSYSFWLMGYPAVWLFEHQSTPFWHTTSDVLHHIDGAYAAEIARSALALLLTLDKLTVVSPVTETVPTTLRLCQNYPNPFNPSTTIEYELPTRCHVTLTVYNLLGQAVALLANDVQEAGFRSVEFNASSLPSGVYLYRLQAGEFVTTKKLVVLK
jgi:hypothetical protein